MLTGISYLLTSLCLALLVAWASRSSSNVAGDRHVFVYSRPVLWLLLLCIPVWIAAAAVVKYTARPGIDGATTINVFVGLFVLASLASTVLYVHAKRFYVAVEEDGVRWRKLQGTNKVVFQELESIQIKRLPRGVETICLNVGGKPVLTVSNTIQDFAELKALLQDRGRRFGVEIRREP